jgi:para-aminobenzoate synthetase
MWGVQFHPESVATEHGVRLVENFYALARRLKSPRWRGAKRPPRAPPRSQARRARGGGESELRLRTIPGEPSTEALFERLFGDAEHAFWLDSADAPTRLAQRSFLGTSAGPGRCVLESDVESGTATRHGAGAPSSERASIFDLLDPSSSGTRSSHPPPTCRPG